MDAQTVTESKWCPIQLTNEDVEQLTSVGRQLAGQSRFWGSDDESLEDSHRSVLDVRIAPGGYELFARNFVGAIALSGFVLHVKPKIDRTHFAFLALHSDWSHRGLDVEAQSATDESFLDVVAYWFLNAAESLLRTGVLRDYRGVREDLRFVRGRIHPLSTSRMLSRGRLDLDIEYEEYDFDSPHNRILQAATQAIAWSPMFSPAARTRARVVGRQLPEVSELRSSDLFEPVMRHAAAYGAAIPWARRILWSRGVFPEAALASARTFVIPTPGLIESALRNLLASELAGTCIVERFGKAIPGSPGWKLTPDLIFTIANELGARRIEETGDVKYKLGQDLAQNDLHQAVTFATHFQAGRALVLGFRDNDRVDELRLEVGSVTVETLHWRATAFSNPADELSRVISIVRARLEFGTEVEGGEKAL